MKTELAPSRSDARRAVEQGGVSVADAKVTDIKTTYSADSFGADGLVVKRGKKKIRQGSCKINRASTQKEIAAISIDRFCGDK